MDEDIHIDVDTHILQRYERGYRYRFRYTHLYERPFLPRDLRCQPRETGEEEGGGFQSSILNSGLIRDVAYHIIDVKESGTIRMFECVSSCRNMSIWCIFGCVTQYGTS